jgi:hypothetical protein
MPSDLRTELAVDTTTVIEIRQRRDRFHQAIVSLEESLMSSPADASIDLALHASLGELRTVFDHHVRATEADDGLLAETVQHAPRMVRAAERIRDDHREISALIDAALTAAPVRGAHLVDLLARLHRHRHLGADFVYEAYHVDLTGE